MKLGGWLSFDSERGEERVKGEIARERRRPLRLEEALG